MEERREESLEQHIERLIDENVRKMRFGDIENPINMICPITRDEFSADDEVGIINHCNHIFNYDVLVSWLSRNFVCPLCRYDIRGEGHQGENEHPQILSFREIVDRIAQFLNQPDDDNNNDNSDNNDEHRQRQSSMIIRLSNGRRRRRLNPEPE